MKGVVCLVTTQGVKSPQNMVQSLCIFRANKLHHNTSSLCDV